MNHITSEDFNRMATAILLKYMEYDNIPDVQRMKALEKFNKWLNDSTQQEIIQNQNQKQDAESI